MNRKERRAAGGRSGEVAALLAAAVRHHQAGQFVQAEAGYRAVLARDARQSRALYYLGVICAHTGRHDAARDLISQAAILDPRNAELRFNLGAAHHGAGRLDEAVAEYRQAIALDPRYAQAHMNLGNVLAARGDTAGASACYDAVLALDPGSAAAHYNAANVLARAGDLAAAAGRYERAIALQPQLAEPHNNLGNVLRSLGRAADAEAAYRRALALQPDFADAHNNLGTVLMARDAVEEGIGHYRAAVRARPGFAEAHNNLGLALFRAGAREEAIRHFEQAAALDPASVDALLNLARQLYAAGDVAGAIEIVARALRVRETPDARHLLAIYAGALPDAEQAAPYRDTIARALREGWAPAGEIERVSALLVRRNPAMAALLGGAPAQPAAGLASFKALAEDRLLGSLMAAARICDPDLERLLTAARSALLAAAAAGTLELAGPMLEFAGALARQCFVNEYVFAESAEDRVAAERLAGEIAQALDTGRTIAPALLAALACCRPLHTVPGASRLLSRSWPAAIDGLLTQQVREPVEEQAIAATLRALTSVDDAVSRQVRAQYEENPYPRWVAPMPPVNASPLREHLRLKFPLAPLRAPQAADVLIAGCGTGAHAIDVCRRIRDAHVLAIDLSRASLSYAARKTRELGLPIDYAQADILALGGVERRFDLIEASGVLHHLADPFAGWRILLGLLKPAGVMSVGLYSKLARAEVNAARTFIAARGYGAGAQDIRRCRQDILAFPPGTPGRTVIQSGDFYAMSSCRDLLFHVQEHQHTLPEIAAFLAAQGLQFLGFELDQRVLNAYVARNPEDPAAIDLDRWHRFEADNPGLFAGMYQFAVQRR